MIGPILWLRSIRERFEFRYARISLHKTWRRSKRTPGPAENYAKFVFVFQKGLKPCDFKGSRKHRDTKIIGLMIGCSIGKRLRYRIQLMSHTHKRSYKKNFLAHIGVGAAWNSKPKWDGPCKYRPLPAASPLPARNDSRMTGLRFHKSCWSTKSKYHVEKDDFQFKPLFHFRWFDSYNMRKISQKSTNFLFCSYTLLSPWSCKTLETFKKQSRTETK